MPKIVHPRTALKKAKINRGVRAVKNMDKNKSDGWVP